MPYNAELAARVRAALSDEPDVVERKMFGGLCFMLAGNLCVGVDHDDLMVRVAIEDAAAVGALPHVRPMDITGRPAKNLFFVSAEGTRTKRALASWVERGRAFARSLPPKQGATGTPRQARARVVTMPRDSSEEGTRMPYNAKLAERVRAILGDEPDLIEQKMFGGLSFMLAGNLCVGILGDDLVVRVPKGEAEATSTLAHVRPLDFTGRPMKHWFYVAPEGTKTKRALTSWVERGRAFARTLPPK